MYFYGMVPGISWMRCCALSKPVGHIHSAIEILVFPGTAIPWRDGSSTHYWLAEMRKIQMNRFAVD